MRIRAIALDMDGTLLNSKNEISEAGIRLLERIHDKGIYIFLSTGRTKAQIHEVLPENFPIDGMVTANGAGCYINENTLLENSLEFQQVKKLISLARQHKMYYEIHPFNDARMAYKKDRHILKEIVYRENNSSVPESWINFIQKIFERKIHWIDRLSEIPIAKVFVFHKDKMKLESFIKEIKQSEDYGDFSISSSAEHNVEIVSEGATKATGLELFLKKFDLSPEELIAFGDGENDLPMFELAKHAVAMKNAPDFVKRKADDVTDYTNEEHGVFHYINEHKEIFDLE